MAWDEAAKWSDETDETYWKSLLSDESAIPAGLGSLEAERRAKSAETTPQELENSSAAGAAVSAAAVNQDWRGAQEALESGAQLELAVMEFNRGGLLVRFGSLNGFVPCSQLAGLPRLLSSDQRMQVLHERVGQTMKLHVIEVDHDRRRLILSELSAQKGHDGAELLTRLRPGEIRNGQVIHVRPFGVFVDLGGVDGLIHISELSWGWVSHPTDLLRPGDEVQVYVIGVNQQEGRVALSLKRLTPDPWTLVDERYSVGQIVQGVITNVVSFGAFMQLEEGLEGLIHISELANGNFTHPRMVVQEGNKVTARVLDIDSANRRLALSLRRAHSPGRQGAAIGDRELQLQETGHTEWSSYESSGEL